MTHREFIEKNFEVLDKTENTILFDVYGVLCCEINGKAFHCDREGDYYELVELFGNENFEE